MTERLTHDHEVCGVALIKIARLMCAVAASADNQWKLNKDGITYRLVGTVCGHRLHIVEKTMTMELRGDGWMISLATNYTSIQKDMFRLPSASGSRHQPDSRSDTFPARIDSVEIKSANAFRHDMTILLMFESEWGV